MNKGLYLGREVDAATGQPGPRVDLNPRDLLTHGLIVGMTGSGKTGLAIGLIEELLQQGVPVLAIDPKGDLGNLLLLFDDLAGPSFAPWVDPEAARRAGQDVQTAGAAAAAAWQKGLASWDLAAADVARLRASHEAVIYTPGSSSGVPLNILQSLDAPDMPFDSAEEDLRDEIAGIVAGLLGLLSIDADPLRSRESILLSNIIEHEWRAGRGLQLESLVGAIADPPFTKLGALPVESVYPKRERHELMMALNNLLASPSFEAWREGEPLDVDRMLRAADGRPRLSIVYTAHLSDQERLFVTALLLDKVKTWMRRQGGTSELRAVVYMDEIYGYFPPHPANPPTKRPLLTLLKQARAQGVGVVLATQNPVDLDYKGLANIGLWLVGTLQTQQDRARLADGLQGASLSPAQVDALLDKTRKRVFLMHDVHRPAPCLLESRWAMSYLRGPLTRDEIVRLKAPTAQTEPRAAARPAAAATPALPPTLPPPLRHAFLSRHGGDMADPWVLVKYAVRFKGGAETVGVRAWPLAGATAAEALEEEPIVVEESAVSDAAARPLRYADLPAFLTTGGAKVLERALKERLADKLAIVTWTDPLTKATSEPGETRDAFATRIEAAGGGAKAEKLRDTIARKKRDLATKEEDLSGRRTEKWAAVGGAILSNIGLFSGRKRTVSGAGSVLSKNRMENTAEARVESLKAEIGELEQELEAHARVDASRLEETVLVPLKTGVKLLRYDVLWVS